MHEVGRLVGLEHASKAGQIMLPSGGSLEAAVWGAGDLSGLRKIGKVAGCRWGSSALPVTDAAQLMAPSAPMGCRRPMLVA